MTEIPPTVAANACSVDKWSASYFFDSLGPSLLVLFCIIVIILFFGADPDNITSKVKGKVNDTAGVVFEKFHKIPILVLILGASFILISASLGHHGIGAFVPAVETASSFVKEFGFALIIAYFISIGIERIARERHNEELKHQIDLIKENVLMAVHGLNHELQVVKFVDEHIYKYPYIKKNYDISVRIEFQDKSIYSKENVSPDDIVIVNVTTRADVHNISGDDKKYPIVSFVEKPYINGGVGLSKIKRILLDGKELSKEELDEADKKKEDDEDFTWYKYERIIESGRHLNVIIEYEFIKFARDEMAWRSREAATGIYISADVPTGMGVRATAMHVNDKVAPKLRATNSLEMEITGPSFPHNGFLIWWAPDSFLPKRGRQGESGNSESQRAPESDGDRRMDSTDAGSKPVADLATEGTSDVGGIVADRSA